MRGNTIRVLMFRHWFDFDFQVSEEKSTIPIQSASMCVSILRDVLALRSALSTCSFLA